MPLHDRPRRIADDASGLEHAGNLIDRLLAEQQLLQTPISRFSQRHHGPGDSPDRRYRDLIPLSKPAEGEQYAFEVNLDQCTACTACVVACHSLNGLDEGESWRDVGQLVGTTEAYAQTVTTACHHCLDPACLNGCPVLAYEKDPSTGIVRHLDDQCIGCGYCSLKCPYDVPKFNRRRGIVRKCDMCHQRLAADEAPACVQACPNGAIAIRIVRTDHASAAATGSGVKLMPGTVASSYTQPTTRYVTARGIPPSARPADAARGRPEPAHTALVVMLVLTQWSAGAMLAGGPSMNMTAACALLTGGLLASILHLGQPLKAWRSFLGWRRSWLSREIIVFGIWAALAATALLGWTPRWPAVAAGLTGIACSVMVYADTCRPVWTWPISATRFFGTAAVLGAATAASVGQPRAAVFAAALAACKLAIESAWLRHPGDNRLQSADLQSGPLGKWTRLRFATGSLGAALVAFIPPVGLALLAAGEFIERSLFFRSGVGWRMPGRA